MNSCTNDVVSFHNVRHLKREGKLVENSNNNNDNNDNNNTKTLADQQQNF